MIAGAVDVLAIQLVDVYRYMSVFSRYDQETVI